MGRDWVAGWRDESVSTKLQLRSLHDMRGRVYIDGNGIYLRCTPLVLPPLRLLSPPPGKVLPAPSLCLRAAGALTTFFGLAGMALVLLMRGKQLVSVAKDMSGLELDWRRQGGGEWPRCTRVENADGTSSCSVATCRRCCSMIWIRRIKNKLNYKIIDAAQSEVQ
jgi:hypothetical protein